MDERVARWGFVIGCAVLIAATILPATLTPGVLPGEGVDLDGTIWFFTWMKRCVLEGGDPSYTDAFYYPGGKNIFAHTGNNLVDAVLSVPLQLVLPGRWWYPAWLAVMMAWNAVAFRWLTHHEIDDPMAGRLATWLFLVNPYFMLEIGGGRPTQAFVPFLIIALGQLRRVDEGWRAVLTAGVAAGLTGWTYWFYGYFFAFVAPWIAAVAWWERPRGQKLRYVAHLAASALVGAAVIGPGVGWMVWLRRAGELPGVNKLDAGRSVFQLPFKLVEAAGVAPQNYTILELDGPHLALHPAWIGLLLAWIALGAGRRRWLGVLVLALEIAAGLSVTWHGMMVRNLPYLVAFHKVPFFERLWFPYRAMSIGFIVMALGAGFVFAEVRRRSAGRGPGFAARAQLGVGVGALLLGLFTLNHDGYFPLFGEDMRMRPVYGWMKERPGAIVELPFGRASRAVRDQSAHGMPLYGGMAENAKIFFPRTFVAHQRNTFLAALVHAAAEPASPLGFRPVDRLAAEREGFRWVVLHRNWLYEVDPPMAVAAIDAILGPPVATEGPRVVWSLDPNTPRATGEFALTGLDARTFPEEEVSSLDQRLRALGRLKEGPMTLPPPP